MNPDIVFQLIGEYRYMFLIPGVLFLGPILSLAAGVLLRLGTLELFPTALALAGGELFGDVLWYWLGRHFGDSFVSLFGTYFGITEPRIRNIKRQYHVHHDWLIFVSKLTAGFAIAPVIFFTAGLSRVHFGRYMTINIAGQIIWTTIMLSIGYFLGQTYLQVNNIFDALFYGAVTILVLAALYGFFRYLRTRIEGNV